MTRKDKITLWQSFIQGPSPVAKKTKRTPVKFLLIVLLIIGVMHLSTKVFAPSPEKDAWGKLLVPVTGMKFNLSQRIVGETQDIAAGQYIWVVIETKKTGTCLPIKRVLRNSRFRTTLENPTALPPFYISIWVIEEERHLIWSDRIKNTGEQKTVTLPPENRRLDKVELLP